MLTPRTATTGLFDPLNRRILLTAGCVDYRLIWGSVCRFPISGHFISFVFCLFLFFVLTPFDINILARSTLSFLLPAATCQFAIANWQLPVGSCQLAGAKWHLPVDTCQVVLGSCQVASGSSIYAWLKYLYPRILRN